MSVLSDSAENPAKSLPRETATERAAHDSRFRPLADAFGGAIARGLSELDARGLRRSTRSSDARGPSASKGTALVNLIGNDALGIGADIASAKAFLETLPDTLFRFSASASRVLSGSSAAHDALEAERARRYGRPDGVSSRAGMRIPGSLRPSPERPRTRRRFSWTARSTRASSTG